MTQTSSTHAKAGEQDHYRPLTTVSHISVRVDAAARVQRIVEQRFEGTIQCAARAFCTHIPAKSNITKATTSCAGRGPAPVTNFSTVRISLVYLIAPIGTRWNSATIAFEDNQLTSHVIHEWLVLVRVREENFDWAMHSSETR